MMGRIFERESQSPAPPPRARGTPHRCAGPNGARQADRPAAGAAGAHKTERDTSEYSRPHVPSRAPGTRTCTHTKTCIMNVSPRPGGGARNHNYINKRQGAICLSHFPRAGDTFGQIALLDNNLAEPAHRTHSARAGLPRSTVSLNPRPPARGTRSGGFCPPSRTGLNPRRARGEH